MFGASFWRGTAAPIEFWKKLKKITAWMKQEAVLCITLLCAVVTMIFVPPSAAYIEYFDWRVLALLFCLMAVVAGFTQCGLLDNLARRLLEGEKPLRLLALALVALPFFTSMIITNDVALIAFVPFALLVLTMLGRQRYAVWIVVLQTLAANLGSMATPIGNPQNLFLYSFFELSPGEFFRVVLPPALVSLVLIALLCLRLPAETLHVQFFLPLQPLPRKRLLLFGALLVLCLFTVFRVIPWYITLAVTAAALAFFARELFAKIDYALLATFVFFFIFAGNLGEIPAARTFFMNLMQQIPLTASALASQFISNVPAAVLLADFTQNSSALLAGVNVGGLGTPVASLASLISLKLYMRTPQAQPKRYLAVFLGLNAAFLAVLYVLCAAWNATL